MEDLHLQKLITGCIGQDRKDQKALYKAYYGFAMGICIRYAGNRYEAVEIMNQGFFNIFTKINKYDNVKPFKAWVGCIMKHSSIDFYRNNWKIKYTDSLEMADEVLSSDSIVGRLEYEDLLTVIRRLPQTYRAVFSLYAIDGYSHQEISLKLGICEGTSKSNLFKAREKLKKMLVYAYN
ncbi:MAG: sigma-70 family RNA polymerase sigma factor [Bacteroidota bacterium]|nr:sigma-70 family RNA polymerase sigma factor [Bacteroidota bacterium]